jgi:hypothetical protein
VNDVNQIALSYLDIQVYAGTGIAALAVHPKWPVLHVRWQNRCMAVTREQVQRFVPRFLAALDETQSCWYLTGRARENGYTTIQVGGVKMSGHRFSYAAFVGTIPHGFEIDHLCRDRACVNPKHLELVSRSENLRRRDSFGKSLGHLPIFERIIARRSIDSNGCWSWTGAKVRGYGVLSIDGRTQYVHRVVYRLSGGNLDDSVTLDHLCRQPSCFNPEHLEPVTREENARRVPKDGRRVRTCRNGHERKKVGTNPDGSCAACSPERARRGPPRRPREETSVRCAQGHLYSDVGRYPSGGCVACQSVKDKARIKGPRPPVQYCPRGHDVFVVGRSSSNGQCRECARQYARDKHDYKRTAADLETHCRNGHLRTLSNTRTVNRVRDGKAKAEQLCVDCRRDALCRYKEKLRK